MGDWMKLGFLAEEREYPDKAELDHDAHADGDLQIKTEGGIFTMSLLIPDAQN